VPLPPRTEADVRYGDPDVVPVAWVDAIARLSAAEIYWVATVRPGRGPHLTPVIGVVDDGIFHFCTGVGEQKERNLRSNAHCTVVTGTNDIATGTDVILEGVAEQVIDDAELKRLAVAWADKYGDDWRFEVSGGAFHHRVSPSHDVPVFGIRPSVGYAFGRAPSSHTRYSFAT